MSDLKVLRNLREGKVAAARPQLSLTQYNGQVYSSRGTGYGADKYARGNYFGPPPAGVDPVDRFLGYIDAALRHLGKVAQAINVAKGTGGDARAACALPDDDSSGGFPPSMLPHVAHALAGLNIMVECGVTDGLLPVDPGEPWKLHPMYAEVQARRAAGAAGSSLEGKKDVEIRAEQGLPQKDDPDSERRRVESLLLASPPPPRDLEKAARAVELGQQMAADSGGAAELGEKIAADSYETEESKLRQQLAKHTGDAWQRPDARSTPPHEAADAVADEYMKRYKTGLEGDIAVLRRTRDRVTEQVRREQSLLAVVKADVAKAKQETKREAAYDKLREVVDKLPPITIPIDLEKRADAACDLIDQKRDRMPKGGGSNGVKQ